MATFNIAAPHLDYGASATGPGAVGGACGACRRRDKLATAAATANKAATPSATGSACVAKRKAIAAKVAPIVWPVSRAVASIPPAAPLRPSGADDSIVRLFGDWKKPKPSPHMPMRQAMPIEV